MFSDKLTFTGGGDILVPGTPFGGGYYAGKINIEGNIYALVVAPAALGGQNTSGLAWKTSKTQTSGTSSLNDGAANTQAMVNAGISNHPAAQFCKNLTIGGFNDWYLPSVNELEIAYRNLKPDTASNYAYESGAPNGAQGYNPSSVPIGAAYTYGSPARTNVTAFIANGEEAFSALDYYWTSTSYPVEGYTWYQRFDNGGQVVSGIRDEWYVRGFRRVLIS